MRALAVVVVAVAAIGGSRTTPPGEITFTASRSGPPHRYALYGARPDGGSVRVIGRDLDDVRWSPDGSRFVSYSSHGFLVGHADGSGVRTLLRASCGAGSETPGRRAAT
jgi:hypothetical protein